MRTSSVNELDLTIYHATVVEPIQDGVQIYEDGITIRLSDSVANKVAREQIAKGHFGSQTVA